MEMHLLKAMKHLLLLDQHRKNLSVKEQIVQMDRLQQLVLQPRLVMQRLMEEVQGQVLLLNQQLDKL
jgi:hypothetical protein